MSIIDSIKKAREEGLKDEQILREIVKQNPDKNSFFNESRKKGLTASQIIKQIVSQNTPQPARVTPKFSNEPEPLQPVETRSMPDEAEEEIRLREAKKRVEALKRMVREKEAAETTENAEMAKETKEVKAADETWATKVAEEEPVEKFEEFAKAAPRPKPPEMKKPVLMPQQSFEIIRPVPQKPNFREKIWIRLLVFSLIFVGLAGVFTFWYWYFMVRPQIPPTAGCASNTDCPSGYYCSSTKVCVQEGPTKCAVNNDCPQNYICGESGICVTRAPEPTIPPSLFSVEDTKILPVASAEELRNLMQQTVKEWLDSGQFRRIVAKNTADNKALGLKDFFDEMLVRFPAEIYQKLENDFTFFIYSQKEGNRFGLAVRIKNNEGLVGLLKSYESTMENDLGPLFTLIGKSGPAVITYFRNSSNIVGYVGPNFRFQSLTKQDMGICYLTADNYFVLTSSIESMKKTITKLAITGQPVELTLDLKQGDKNDEVSLLQTWLKQDPIVYPEGKVTGFFGVLTKAAIIRFQEKYASDILAPQGLLKGNGIVDSYTRIKLNELYSTSGIIPPKPELTTDLRYGDHGNEVKLLQTWLAKDSEVYPEGKISGWFGPLTKQATIRFQEKYKTEILTPQGLDRGTGIVDAATRKKLNELYGK